MTKKKLLLHMCCGPCSVYVVHWLQNEYETTGFFYNPNIHPLQEYEFRMAELQRVANIKKWRVVFAEHDMLHWFHEIKGLEKEREKGARCSLCFRLRLRKTFEFAKENGFAIVATTLSISPYKNTNQINTEGKALSEEFNIEFLAENFKKQNGYTIAKQMAQELGIRFQDYCGCVFSKVDKKLHAGKKEKQQQDQTNEAKINLTGNINR